MIRGMTYSPSAPLSVSIPITAEEFAWFTTFLRRHSGIELKDGKQALVMSRLERRLRHYEIATYREYFALISAGSGDEDE